MEGAREFRDQELAGARFVGCDLSGAVLRGVAVSGMEIESPWLFEGEPLVVNGVDVLGFVDGELNQRFPGRTLRTATDPAGLVEAYERLQDAWSATVERVRAMPAGTRDRSVAGEWSFAETLRHLVLATDMWLGKAVLGEQQPFHAVGLLDSGTLDDGVDTTPFTNTAPTFDEVLEARGERVDKVRRFLATLAAEDLARTRPNPHDPSFDETVLSCLHTILDEEWEHLRYAVRDLDALEAGDVEG